MYDVLPTAELCWIVCHVKIVKNKQKKKIICNKSCIFYAYRAGKM